MSVFFLALSNNSRGSLLLRASKHTISRQTSSFALVFSRDAFWLKQQRPSHYCCARVHTSAFTPNMLQKGWIFFPPQPWEHVSQTHTFNPKSLSDLFCLLSFKVSTGSVCVLNCCWCSDLSPVSRRVSLLLFFSCVDKHY